MVLDLSMVCPNPTMREDLTLDSLQVLDHVSWSMSKDEGTSEPNP